MPEDHGGYRDAKPKFRTEVTGERDEMVVEPTPAVSGFSAAVAVLALPAAFIAVGTAAHQLARIFY